MYFQKWKTKKNIINAPFTLFDLFYKNKSIAIVHIAPFQHNRI